MGTYESLMQVHLLAAAVFFVWPTAAAWDTPLYLYASSTNNDTALLATAPSTTVAAAESYTLVFSEPVAFAASAASTTSDAPLYAYWSAERRDIQTTNSDLATLNEHGGNYSLLQILGYLQSRAVNGSWWSGIQLVPLQLSYSPGRRDAVTGPWSSADVNELPVFSKTGAHADRW